MKSLTTDPQTRRAQAWRDLLAPKLRRIAVFLRSQGIATTGNLLFGFLCVRLLPITDYAEYAVVFGFLGTLTVLSDIGISSTLLPLVGERIDDSQLIADYVASLRQLALWVYFAVAPLIAIVFPLVVRHQRWSGKVVAGMVAILLVAGWRARASGNYGAVLIVRRDLAFWYRIQMISSLGALCSLGFVWTLHWFNAFSAMLINVAAIVFTGTAYYLRAQHLLGTRGHPSAEKRKSIVHLAMPSMPTCIFYAFNGQISLLLITWFGHSRAVAGIGALNRLSRFFVLAGQMNPLLIEPYFAKLPPDRVKRNYLGLIAIEVVFCLFMTGMAGQFPELFLWVLGPKYYNLRAEVVLLIAACSIGHLYEAILTAHNARRFVYWWNGAISILLILGIEIVFIWKVDLSTVRSVIILNLITAAGILLINVATGIYGFLHGPREITGMLLPLEQGAPYE